MYYKSVDLPELSIILSTQILTDIRKTHRNRAQITYFLSSLSPAIVCTAICPIVMQIEVTPAGSYSGAISAILNQVKLSDPS